MDARRHKRRSSDSPLLVKQALGSSDRRQQPISDRDFARALAKLSNRGELYVIGELYENARRHRLDAS